MTEHSSQPSLGVTRGAALYVGALIGPGVLLVPALAVQAAGAASIVAWIALLLLSAPLAIVFAALGVRHPVAGGVSAYVREGVGDTAAAVTGGWFVAAVVCGAPAVALIGGWYVADLTGSGIAVASSVGLAMFAAVLAANTLGLRVSSGFQLALSSLLVAVLAVAVAVALPSRGGDNWTPFAPHGWWSIGTAANILVWLFVGWEAVAQLAGEFRDPARDLPRAIAVAFGVVTVLYVALAVAAVAIGGAGRSKVPLADLMAVGFGRAGRDATAVLAVALTMGTMNVYIGGAAKLTASLAEEGALPLWLARGAPRSVPRRPLVLLGVAGCVLLGGLIAGLGTTDDFVRATSACFIAVYALALLSAVRILDGGARAAAAVTLALVLVVAVFSSWFLAVPAAAGVAAVALRSTLVARSASARAPDPDPLD
ncbi:MAG TPA: amino acid permease [Gaiellaceae bacterium]|nr:amino acid permease [Gaiellaceae bacterium]